MLFICRLRMDYFNIGLWILQGKLVLGTYLYHPKKLVVEQLLKS